MKSPPQQIHDDIAFNRVEAFIRGEDNETLVGHRGPGQAQAPQARRHQGAGRGRRGEVTDGDAADGVARRARLEAPHRRGGTSPRDRRAAGRRRLPRDGVAVRRVLPAGPPGAVVGRAARRLSYLAVADEARAGRTATSAHVLGLPPDDPRVRRLALRAYREYGRYLVELMRLPSHAARRGRRPAPTLDADDVRRDLARGARAAADPGRRPRRQQRGGRARRSPATGCRSASSPTIRRSRSCSTCCVASASAGASRSSRGATCARSSACCGGARCSASSSTGATAATASRSGCSAPGRRCRPGRRRWPPRPGRGSCRSRSGASPTARFRVTLGASRSTSPSADPAELQRATQAHRRRAGRDDPAAPEQWYSFKPIWPADRRGGRRPRAASAA